MFFTLDWCVNTDKKSVWGRPGNVSVNTQKINNVHDGPSHSSWDEIMRSFNLHQSPGPSDQLKHSNSQTPRPDVLIQLVLQQT